VKNIASLGLAIGYPTVASLPHSVIRGYKNVLAISLGTDYVIPQAEKLKNAAAAAPAAASSAPAAAKKEEAPKKEEKKEESEEDVGGFGLFGDD